MPTTTTTTDVQHLADGIKRTSFGSPTMENLAVVYAADAEAKAKLALDALNSEDDDMLGTPMQVAFSASDLAGDVAAECLEAAWASGNQPVAEVTKEDLEAHLVQVEAREGRTVADYVRWRLRGMLDTAVAIGWRRDNPLAAAPEDRHDPSEVARQVHRRVFGEPTPPPINPTGAHSLRGA